MDCFGSQLFFTEFVLSVMGWIPRLGVRIAFLAVVLVAQFALGADQPAAGEPLVMKVYPDGTQLILKWNEVGQKYDDGAAHGGPPRIVPYRPLGGAASYPDNLVSARDLPPSQKIGLVPPDPEMDSGGFTLLQRWAGPLCKTT